MKQKNGAWLLALAAMLCSIGGVCIKGVPWTPLAINGARNAIAACITGAFLWRAGRRLRWNGAVACGALSLALTTNLYVFATKLAGAANAILLMYTAPIFVLLYLWLAKGQKPPRAAVAACVLVFAGIGCFVADGLAAGKGVVVAQTKEEALEALDQIMGGVFGAAGSRVVIEEFLVGEEVSLLAFCDGKTALPLPSAQDHKAVFDGDTGPNTGGMGAYSPAPIVPDAELEKMADIAIRPILAEMARQGHPFTGILYAGLMMTKDGPKVLEYNVRFGDPECEPLLMRLESDLLEIMDACIDGRLDEVKLSIRPESALGVVIAAEGYPGSYPKGMEIKGIDAVDALPDTKVFQAGTKREGSRTLSSGGRVLCVTALGKGLAEAQKRAHEAVAKIDMEKSQHRSDIGAKGLRRL